MVVLIDWHEPEVKGVLFANMHIVNLHCKIAKDNIETNPAFIYIYVFYQSSIGLHFSVYLNIFSYLILTKAKNNSF